MKKFPNIKAYHKLIGQYINIVPPENITSPDSSSDNFFFELISRTHQEIIKRNGYDGLGDLSGIEINVVQDVIAKYVVAAAQKINHIRKPEDYFAGHLGINHEFHSEELTMQFLQEKSAKKLLDIYKPFSFTQQFKGEDWKAGRCAFWRYLMYSGFMQVNERQTYPEIIKESIPKKDLLTKLAKRFSDIWELEEYNKEVVSIPEKLAHDFLVFNRIKG